jgi:hypothetical protein
MYVCAGRELADRVRECGEAQALSIERGTLRVELLEVVRCEAIESSGLASVDWHLNRGRA